MEELHRIHKDVPFGYWALWLEPALKKLARAWRADAKPATRRTTAIAQ